MCCRPLLVLLKNKFIEPQDLYYNDQQEELLNKVRNLKVNMLIFKTVYCHRIWIHKEIKNVIEPVKPIKKMTKLIKELFNILTVMPRLILLSINI